MSNIVPAFTSSSHDIDDTVEISAGQYWKHSGGNVHLISSLNIIDNELHSIEVSPHPRHGGGGRFMSDEFFSKFVPITPDEAEAIRSAEIKEVEAEMNQIKLEMDAGYHDEDGVSAKLLIERVSSSGIAQISMSPDAAHKQIEVIGERSKQLQDIAQKQAEFIQEKSKAIATKTSLVASFYTEKGKQALASVDHTLKCVKKLQKSVYTLEVFTGKGVDVIKLRDGEPAPSDEPLTFFQRKLFLDEEWFFNLKNGGADFNNVVDFRDAVQKDFSVIERMAPSPRSVVLLQMRRSEKSYFPKGHQYSIGDIFYETSMNDANKERILLIRNGERVHIVRTEDIANGARLFPTALEIDDTYRVSMQKNLFGGMTIDTNDQKLNPRDLGYVEARNSHDEKTIYYQRVILILCGIHLRDNDVFGDFKNSAQFENWFNEVFQFECCRFVHDDEDALSDGITPVMEWIKEKNSVIQPGTRLICNWGEIMDETTAPGAVKYSIDGRGYERTHWLYRPIKNIGLAVVKSSLGELYVEVECYKSFGSDIEKKIKVFFERCGSYNYLLAIDNVRASEIHYYLESRRHRKDYLNYVSAFMLARDVLREEESVNMPFVQMVIDGACSTLPQCSRSDVESAVYEAVRMWRADNNGKLLPIASNKDYKKVLNSIGKQVWAILSGDAITAIEEYCAANAIDPSYVFMNGSGEYEVIVPDKSMTDSNGLALFATAMLLKQNKKGLSLDGSSLVMNRIESGKRVVKSYSDTQSEFAINAHSTFAAYVEYMRPIIENTTKRLIELHGGGYLNEAELNVLKPLYNESKQWGGDYAFFPLAIIVHGDEVTTFGFQACSRDIILSYASPEDIAAIREYRGRRFRHGRENVDKALEDLQFSFSPFEFRAMSHDIRKAFLKPKHGEGIIGIGEYTKIGKGAVFGRNYYSGNKSLYSENDDFTEYFLSEYSNSKKERLAIIPVDSGMNQFFPPYDQSRHQDYYSCDMRYSIVGTDTKFSVVNIIVTEEETENTGFKNYRLSHLFAVGYPEKARITLDEECVHLANLETGDVKTIPMSSIQGWGDSKTELIAKLKNMLSSGDEIICEAGNNGFQVSRIGELGRVFKKKPTRG